MSIIEVKNLSFTYTQQKVLDNISFDIEKGSFLAIAGPNGAGKSTLINLLSAILKKHTGTIKIDQRKVESYSTKALSRKIAVVRQEFTPVFGFSVMETVMMARTTHYGTVGFDRDSDRQIVNEALDVTDTARFTDRLLSNLSSGERQRVFIARAYAQNTPVLLLDEPTSFLDYKHQVKIFDLLKKSQMEKSKTIVAAIHDINLASQYADTALFLGADNNFLFGPAKQILTADALQKVFDVKILQAASGDKSFFFPQGNWSKESEKPESN